MNLESRIKAFTKLGEILGEFVSEGIPKNDDHSEFHNFFELLRAAINKAYLENPWFTERNILFSLKAWSKLLNWSNLKDWTSQYNHNDITPKTVAIIMAGNIPLVGFHDFLCVLITGHKVLVKQSSNDQVLLNILCDFLIDIEPGFKDYIQFTEGQLTGFDAVIATGSNNTARYFDYYFGKYPGIIRKNRNSVAIIKGDESKEQLEALSDDIFRYYGLGCRNVSKLYVPKDYDFDMFFNAVYKWHPIIHEHKYANNYDYNKAVYLMSEFDMLDNGFLVLKQDQMLSSPIATLNFEYYDDVTVLKAQLDDLSDDIQCIVSNGFDDNEVKFGKTQNPDLNTYADQVDTVEFLLTI